MGKKKSGSVLDLPCQFGGVSLGQTTARVGITIQRSVCTINQADESFVGRRLTGMIVLGHNDDQPGQSKLFDTDIVVQAAFDVKRIGVNADVINTGLTFGLKGVDLASLSRFSKGTGRLIVNDIGDLPADAPDEHGEGNGHVPGSLKASGPWAKVKLSTLFEGALLKKLVAAGLETVGNLSDYTASEKRLSDIEGIGPGAAGKIEERMMQFWSDNPNANDQK